MDQQIKHGTLRFERYCDADIERVFAALSDPVERARWSAPSTSAAFSYDAADFCEGGQDVFRCGDRSNPQFTGVTTYIAITPLARIISSEVVESEGRKLMASLITTELERRDRGVEVRMTVQVVSFAGDEMIKGVEAGNNAALDNLVNYVG